MRLNRSGNLQRKIYSLCTMVMGAYTIAYGSGGNCGFSKCTGEFECLPLFLAFSSVVCGAGLTALGAAMFCASDLEGYRAGWFRRRQPLLPIWKDENISKFAVAAAAA